MEYGKRILILSMVICLLFGVASVCAGEVNDTAITAADVENNFRGLNFLVLR